MTDIPIPPEALEAAAKAICFERYDGISAEAQMLWRAQARATCVAMLRAWPSKTIHNDHLHWPQYPHIILPLPQKEITNDKG